MRTAQLRRGNIPALERGDIFLSWSTAPISRAIGWFQGRPGAQDAAEWSHTGVYLGGGMIAEATIPRGGVRPFARYLDRTHRVHVYRCWHWTREYRNRLATIATALSERDYDVLNIARHLLDNLVERVTWDPRKQEGIRPLARMAKDRDGYGQNVCSELVEWSLHFASSPMDLRFMVETIHDRRKRLEPHKEWDKMQPGRVGQARPMDVAHYLKAHDAGLVYRWEMGREAFRYVEPREIR